MIEFKFNFDDFSSSKHNKDIDQKTFKFICFMLLGSRYHVKREAHWVANK